MTRIFLIYSLLIISSCSTSRKVLPFSDPELRKVDYSQLKYWASHPGKKSFSDYIPKDQQPGQEKLPVDIFFVYPTTLTSGSVPKNPIKRTLFLKLLMILNIK